MGNDIFDILNNPVLPLDNQPEWGQQFDSSQVQNINVPSSANDKTDFKSVSRDVWKSMRQGTSYEQRETDVGPYTSNFYGLEENEGVNLPALITFINKAISDCTIPFYWKDFEKLGTYEYYSQKTGDGSITQQRLINNTIPFVYTNETGIEQTGTFAVKMNKRIDYLEDTYAFSLNIGKNSISAYLYYYYDNTKQFRISATETTNSDDFRIDDKYLAISFNTKNLTDFCYLIKEIEGNEQFKIIQSIIIKRYAEAIIYSNSNAELNFLYKNIPNFVLVELHKYITPELMFLHIKDLTDLDDKGIFSDFKDSSNALINCMKSFADIEYLYKQFENDPKFLKQIFYNLDGTSEFEGKIWPNKIIFASLLSTMSLFFRDDKTPKGDFKLDQAKGFGRYKINANTINEDDKEEKEGSIFLKQEITTFVGGGLLIPYDKDLEEGKYYHPLDLVNLTIYPEKKQNSENNETTPQDNKINKDTSPDGNKIKEEAPKPILVAAILVKALAHVEEVHEIEKIVRVGLDIFFILLTFATGGATMSLTVALLGIGLPLFDIAVALSEDELLKSPEGQAFLQAYNGIMLATGVVAAPLLIRSFYRSFVFLFKNVVLEPTKKFLISAMLAVNNEISGVNNFNTIRGTEKIIIFEYKTVCTEVGYHFLKNSTVTALAEENVILQSAQVQVEKQVVTQYTAFYEGVPIASGTMQGVRATLEELVNSKNGLKQELEGIYAAKSLLKPLNNIDELVNLLGKLNSFVKAEELEKAGIKVLFRGTTKDMNGILHTGSNSAMLHGISTSTDPLRAIVFAVESASLPGGSAKQGILQIALPKKLTGIMLQVPNYQYYYELEVILKTSVNDFSKVVTKEISIEQARQLANHFFKLSGQNEIPRAFPRNSNNARELIEEILPKTSLEQSYQFYLELLKY